VEFLAAVQLLLYAGGIITIVVFAIVVTERLVGERISQTSRRMVPGAIVSILFVWVVVRALGARPLPLDAGPIRSELLTKAMGETILTKYVLPFELLALLMLSALLGAIYFARPED
jgi:NADH-quinone oxidoreductase subunit J